MFYYLYQITNKVNNKIYVGVHKTKSLDDGYMGSGKIIRSAIAKHGISNFSKVILEHFDTSEAMYAREAEVVTDEFLLREDVYNLRRGGYGGFEYINKNKLNGFHDPNVARKGRMSASKKLLEKHGSLSEFSKLGGNRCKELKLGIHDPLKQKIYSSQGRVAALSEAAKLKRRNTFARIGHQQGESNSNFGTIWITNGTENKKIKKTDCFASGWWRGRVSKIISKDIPST